MMKQFVLAYLVGLHIVLAVILIKSDFIDRVQRKMGLRQAVAPPEATEHFNRMMRYHSRMDENVPDGATVFIGDSMTQSLCVSAIQCLKLACTPGKVRQQHGEEAARAAGWGKAGAEAQRKRGWNR